MSGIAPCAVSLLPQSPNGRSALRLAVGAFIVAPAAVEPRILACGHSNTLRSAPTVTRFPAYLLLEEARWAGVLAD